MTIFQQIITVALCVLGTMITRFVPFILFSDNKPTPKYIKYLGSALPSAIFAMLVVYCLRNVEFSSGNFGLPELISIVATVALHTWKKNMLLSIAGGTACYMILIQFVF